MECNENSERRDYTLAVTDDDLLYELLDEETAATRRAARVRQRWLRQAAEESATFAGLLLDLAEVGTAVSFGLRNGQRRSGRIIGLGADFVALEVGAGAGGEDHWIRLGVIASLRLAPGAVTPMAAEGDRPVTSEVELIDLLAERVADAARVLLSVGDETLSGRMVAVGSDVISIRSDDVPPTMTYVSAASLWAAVVLRSG